MEKQEYLGIITEEEYKLIEELVKNGKLKEYRYLVDMFDKEKNMLVSMIDESPENIYNKIIEDYLKIVKGISMLVPGLSTGIKDSKSNVSIYTYDGKTKENGVNIDENTRFDLASSTKLFTAIEALKLSEDGKFDLDKLVSDYKNGKYSNLNIPVEQMAKFIYELRTDGRLDERDGKLSLEEIQKRLSSTNIAKDNTFIYSDIPFIILKDIMPKSDEYFKKYFNEEMNLLETSYDRSFGNLTGGRESELNLINDPKARVMERYKIYPGHAGIFSTSKDLVKLFEALDKGFLSDESITKLVTPALDTPILLNSDGSILYTKNKDGIVTGVKNVNRAFGVYYKHPEGIRANEMVDAMGDRSFAIAGFTGSWATFDLQNGLTANILANPLSNENEREMVIDNEKFTIRDCGKHFEDGTRFKVAGKTSKILDDEGNVVGTAPFTRITNTLKEAQIYTLLKLRLAKMALNRKAYLEQSQILADAVTESFETPKTVKGK